MRRSAVASVSARVHQRGFTLLEIMVVVAIIAILSTVVVLNLVGKTHEASVARAKGDLQPDVAKIADFGPGSSAAAGQKGESQLAGAAHGSIHTMSPEHIEWFKAGSALNIIKASRK